MENILLNRIGIILNFIAGFMLAPELIGLERIARAEIWLETQAEIWKQRVDRRYQTILPISYVEISDLNVKVGCLFPTLSFIALTLLWGFIIGPNIILVTKVVLISFLGMFIVVSAFLTGVARITRNDKYGVKSFFAIILFVVGLIAGIPYMFINAILNWSVLSLYLMIAYIPKVLHNIFSFVRQKLEGDEKLKTFVVSLGILIYILGNLLQFIATF